MFDKAKEKIAGFTGFGFMTPKVQSTELESLFPLSLRANPFQKWYITDLYRHILTDCYNKADGINPKDEGMFWDSVVTTEQPEGLITLLAEAMYNKQKIYLGYKAGVVSKATSVEQADIDQKLKEKKKLRNEIVCDFTEFAKTDLLLLYSSLIYNVIDTSNTGLNISKAVQIKIDNLRNSIADSNAADPIKQAKTINRGIKEGKSVMLDGKDIVEIPSFDITPTEKSIEVINGLVANVLGVPLSYVNGALATGISTTGESDELAVDRGLKYYFNSIFKPVFTGLTGISVSFKVDNWRKLASVSDLIPIVEGSIYIPEEEKLKLIAGLLK